MDLQKRTDFLISPLSGDLVGHGTHVYTHFPTHFYRDDYAEFQTGRMHGVKFNVVVSSLDLYFISMCCRFVTNLSESLTDKGQKSVLSKNC